MTEPIQFLRPTTVAKRVGLSRRTLDRMVKRGEFPRPVSLTPSATAWVEGEVEEWMKARIADRDERRES